jgi:hypothetical protein
MVRHRAVGVAVLGFALLARPGLGQDTQPRSGSRLRTANASQVVPAGTVLPLELKNTVNSRTAYEGQAVYCETIFPIALGDHILIPAHSYVRGEVTRVTRPGRVTGKAQLGLHFKSIILPSGVTRPIAATLSSIGGARLEDAKKAKEAEAAASDSGGQNLATQSAGDAVVDASGLGAGNPLLDASEGVGGIIVMLATRGRTIILRPGTSMEITLTEALDLGRNARPLDTSKPPPLKHRPHDQ